MSSLLADLEKLFHEPTRLAIVSELSSVVGGLPFVELKKACELTDGNLSRHLAVLEKSGVVRVEKSFVGVKPRTTVTLTEQGRKEFLKYLATLERILETASKRAQSAEAVANKASARTKFKPA